MKTTILQMIMMAGLVACFASFAEAQTSELYRTEIPFDFSVGKKQYSAGVYSVEVRGAEQKFFVLRDANGENSYAATTSPGETRSTAGAAMDFHRFGDRYVLAAIRTSDRTSAFPIPRSEQKLAREGKGLPVTLSLARGK